MMDRTLSDKCVIAKKHYPCDACERWRLLGYTVADCETEEQKLAVKFAEIDGWRILPGQRYRRVTGIHEGELCTYRARIDMDAVCLDLDLWGDE